MARFYRTAGAIFVILLVLCLLFLGLFQVKILPILLKLAESKAEAQAAGSITEAVSREISNGTLSYEKIICFEKDFEGRITALRTNMQQVNRLKADVLNTINSQLLQTAGGIEVPAGDLFLPELFSGRGPGIPVRILSIGSSQADFISHFTQAGINQTLHKLSMQIRIEGTALVLGRVFQFTASGTVLVAETVIVGQVPHTFS